MHTGPIHVDKGQDMGEMCMWTSCLGVHMSREVGRVKGVCGRRDMTGMKLRVREIEIEIERER